MDSLLNLKKKLIAGLVFSGSVAVSLAAPSLTRSGLEYPIIPSFPGDQVLPHLSINENGGYIISQDNQVDGNGLGIRARRLYSDLSGSRFTFPVNSITEGEQQKGRVAVLREGGAAFAWEGSTGMGHRIYVRFLAPSDTFVGPEVTASADAVGHQSDAALAVLNDGNVVVTWAEEERDGSMQGIFAQRFTPTGTRLGPTFQVNQVARLNQRTPAIATLANGSFVIAYVSDEFRKAGGEAVDIVARIYTADGNPVGDEFALNSGAEIGAIVCANPALVATANGFRAAWSAKFVATPEPAGNGFVTMVVPPSTEGWNVETRSFNAQGLPFAPEAVVNNFRPGSQYGPRLAGYGERQLIVWTSFGQDGSSEGIYARVAGPSGAFEEDEIRVNTRVLNKQIFPAVGVTGQKVVVAWASFVGGTASFDIVAQQYAIAPDDSLAKPAAPFVFGLSQNSLLVTWGELGAQEVDQYQIYVDDEAAPLTGAGGMLTISRESWTAGSTHTIRLGYVAADGRTSPLSDPVTATTWGEDANQDGLPDDWQRENWGKVWPPAEMDPDNDGASNAAEFLAGTDPTDGGSVLRVQISAREQGLYLEWKTQPGNYYQLQVTTDFSSWQNIGSPRFAPSTLDAVPVAGPGQTQYYRVIRMR